MQRQRRRARRRPRHAFSLPCLWGTAEESIHGVPWSTLMQRAHVLIHAWWESHHHRVNPEDYFEEILYTLGVEAGQYHVSVGGDFLRYITQRWRWRLQDFDRKAHGRWKQRPTQPWRTMVDISVLGDRPGPDSTPTLNTLLDIESLARRRLGIREQESLAAAAGMRPNAHSHGTYISQARRTLREQYAATW